jgi:PAS domain S-box-containing protein
MFGYSEAEFLSLSIRELAPPDWTEFAGKKFAELARLEGRGQTENLPMARKDGSAFFSDLTSSRILYQGRPCMMGLIRDVTQRQQTLEALQREQEALRRLLAADDRERQLIAYEIHDGLTQFLVAANMNFEAHERLPAAESKEPDSPYAIGRRMLREGLSEARRLSGNLRPPKIDDRGVVAAIADYLQDNRYYDGIEFEFQHRMESERLDPLLEAALVRVVQEGVANARRHSRSDKVRIELTQQGDRLRLEIRDWGVGFRPQEIRTGSFGLEGIRARVRLLGGTVEIDSAPGHGTQILADFPVLLRAEDNLAKPPPTGGDG